VAEEQPAATVAGPSPPKSSSHHPSPLQPLFSREATGCVLTRLGFPACVGGGVVW
jgi:hypothetical protein